MGEAARRTSIGSYRRPTDFYTNTPRFCSPAFCGRWNFACELAPLGTFEVLFLRTSVLQRSAVFRTPPFQGDSGNRSSPREARCQLSIGAVENLRI